MSFFKFAIFTILFSIYSPTVFAQEINYKKFTDTAQKITFDIPDYWTIKYDKEYKQFICIPITKTQQKIYESCFDGIVFYMEYHNFCLDTLLTEFDKDGENYFTSDRVSHNVPVKFIQGSNWKGVRHDNICGISCKNTGFHAGAGECQYFYFSKGKSTIEISTSGRALDDKIINRLITSFKFLK